MSWSISKGMSYKLGENRYLRFAGATIYPHHVTVSFLLKNDLVERVIVRSIDNRDCMYIGGVLHFRSKEVVDKLIDDIINEIT